MVNTSDGNLSYLWQHLPALPSITGMALDTVVMILVTCPLPTYPELE